MRRVCPWKPQTKKGKDPLPLKTPQFAGSPGWVLLTHSEKGQPEALFVDSNERVTPLFLVMDERVFSDTVFRVTRLASDMYVVNDIRWLNGKNLFETLGYPERQAKICELLDAFHFPDLTALVMPGDVPETIPIRGWETYDDAPGSMGVFLPASE
jgi:hypothetical protein